jgi:hypothetical protein
LLQADVKQNGVMLHSATSEIVAAHRAEIEGLQRENALLRDQLEDVKRERAKWQEEADSWRKQATALLPPPKPATPKPTPAASLEPPPRKGLRGWLHRLSGG